MYNKRTTQTQSGKTARIFRFNKPSPLDVFAPMFDAACC